jgi:hypothetical protein
VALARSGRTDEAIRMAERAIAFGARAAELHGNLGLLLQQRGDARLAAIHLARAAQLDPGNTAWQQAGAPETQVAGPVRAERSAAAAEETKSGATAAPAAPAAMASPSVAEATGARTAVDDTAARRGDAENPSATVAVQETSAPISPEESLTPDPAPVRKLSWLQKLETPPTVGSTVADEALKLIPQAPSAVLLWVQQAPGVLALTTPQALVAATAPKLDVPAVSQEWSVATLPSLAATPDTWVPVPTPVKPAAAAVEISNGNGVRGLANTAAAALREVGLNPVRLTNHKHFRVLQTQVQYRGPQDLEAAQALAKTLGVPANLVVNKSLRAHTPLRVLLGKDAMTLTSIWPAVMAGAATEHAKG